MTRFLPLNRLWHAARTARWPLAGAMRRRTSDAQARREILRQAFRQAAIALAGRQRFDEADALLSRALSAFPDDPHLVRDHALTAHHAGRYRVAIVRWETALAVLPNDPMCYAGLAANCRETGDLDRAREAIDRGLARFPKNLTMVTEAARIAVRQGDYAAALAHWQTALATPRPHPDWLQGHAQALVMLGAFPEAEAALATARAQFPDHHGLYGVEGALLSARQDWPRALAHWTEYRRLHPDDPTGWQQLGIAMQGSRMGEAVEPAAVRVAPAQLEPVEDAAVRDLMLRFESLGDNCEFGLVQRRFAAEPLGLLRWNTVPFDEIVAALDARFDGMGELANTRMEAAANGEYFVQDRRWGLGMHTFLHVGQTDPDVLFAKMCRRIAYLRDKLLADLAAGEKIVVYRSAGLDDGAIELLHRRLRMIGPVRLLAVQPAQALRPGAAGGDPGDVAPLAEGLFVGCLGRLGVKDNGAWDIAFDDWLAICRNVVSLTGPGGTR